MWPGEGKAYNKMGWNDKKLTSEQKLKLRYRFLEGEDIKKLAEEYNISVKYAKEIAGIR